MFEKILVPLDGSQAAETALIMAESLAGYNEGQVLLVRVAPPAQKSKAKQYLQSKQRQLKESGMLVKVLVVEGTAVAKALLETAEAEQVDVIVMCTNGRGRVRVSQMHVGNVTEQILKRAMIPVLVSRLPNG